MKPLLRILAVSKNLWPYYLAIIIFSIVIAALGLATPFIIKSATDYIVGAIDTGNAQISTAIWLAVALLVVDLLGTFFTNISGYLGDQMAVRLRAKLSDDYYKHLLSLPQKYFDEELTGTIINRLNRTITEITNFLNMFANNFFQMLLTLVMIFAITAFYSWWLAVLLIAIYPIFLWLTTITSKKWQKWEGEKNEQIDTASGRFAEVVGQIRVVKSFVTEKTELKSFANHFGRVIGITKKQSNYWHKMDVARRIVLNVIFFAIFAIIFIQTANGTFTIGVMVLLIQLVNIARQPIFGMSFIVDFAQRAVAGSRDYFKVMDEKSETHDAKNAKDLKINDAKISYNDVAFSYEEKEQVLRKISFDVGKGEKVAFVGESGGGKTTITSLLLRLYNPTSGEIEIDGQNIAKITNESLRKNIGVVFQEPALFSGTIRENIAYSRPNATNDEIAKAAKMANAHEFITKFEHGYDTKIGERGLKLSGGQKQRIAVARAILKDAPILILDEATSSLDSKSEHLVQQALDRLMKNRTTLIIAHRLSTIANVDRIVTIKNGRIDEVGSPDKLSQTGGIYAELLELQNGATETAKKRLKKFDIAA